ncbi:hypothetical protein LIER_27437 [Lithospermum erythrorhizon]|uniref:Uncharacterized protein n=1 Tax=Lithospermum erythrorhizon TaxID=34254 RepID=A0AAV3RI07_LITER
MEVNMEDIFMEDNNIFFEDFDWDTEALMREDNFGEDYEPLEEAYMDKYLFEHSEQLRELSGSEDDGEEEIGSSLRRQKRGMDDLKVEISISTAYRAIKATGYLMYRKENHQFATPLKMGFLAGCHIFVCLDGCFLKGAFKGQLLAAVALDADNGIYPVT